MVKRLLLLNGLAALGAVLYHASAIGFIALIWWADLYGAHTAPDFSRVGTLSYYGLRSIEQIIIFAIPAFVFVSGFFVASATPRDQETVSWNVIFARLRKMLAPYLLWSLLLITLDILQGKEMGVQKVFVALLTGQAEPPYYYVPMIVQLYLLAPFLVPLARKQPRLLLGIAAIVQIFFLLVRYPMILGMEVTWLKRFMDITRSYIFTSQVFWFAFGLVVSFHLAAFKAWLVRYRKLFLAVSVFMFLAGMVEWELLLRASGQPWIAPQETLVDQVFSLGVLMAFLGFEQVQFPLEAPLAQLGGKSFGVYLIHSPVLEVTAKLVYHFAPILLGVQIIFQPILVATGLAVPLILMIIVNRTPARRLYGTIFG